MLKAEAVSYSQRQSAEHSSCARNGYNPTTGERDKISLQLYSRRKSLEALNKLIELLTLGD